MNGNFDMSKVARTLENAIKMKARMKEIGCDSANVKCPEAGCGGRLHMRLVGPRKHMRFWCDGECKQQLME